MMTVKIMIGWCGSNENTIFRSYGEKKHTPHKKYLELRLLKIRVNNLTTIDQKFRIVDKKNGFNKPSHM